MLELRRAAVRSQLAQALLTVDRQLPISVPAIGGEGTERRASLHSTDPGEPERVVAQAVAATEADVTAAIDAALDSLKAWRGLGAAGRAAALVEAAAWMRARRVELAALEVRECAKPWSEADADVCEAIDFLEYYARGAIALERGPELLQAPGERNELHYVPRGVTAVISPWNFPLAIACGMTAAALATGNAVVLKPAEQSPGCAQRLLQALRAGGVPAGVVSLLAGAGEVGAALVAHPQVQSVAFTGSLPVGLEIVRAAAEVRPGQRHIKRVIAELGGKNCVIVDDDADLDEVVPAVVSSAFVYAGQKCSAAARVLVHEAVADALIERVAGATQVLAVGQASELASDVPPVIEASAQERVFSYLKTAATDGQIVGQVDHVPVRGWFCPPTVVADLRAGSPVLEEEIFGPVLAIERVSGVEEACEIVDALPFALTGGLFARDPDTIRYVASRTPVGNLYVNRGITGAMVGRQPFGGNRLSGTGSKAGGPDYLLQFVEPRVVTENTVRHGLIA